MSIKQVKLSGFRSNSSCSHSLSALLIAAGIVFGLITDKSVADEFPDPHVSSSKIIADVRRVVASEDFKKLDIPEVGPDATFEKMFGSLLMHSERERACDRDLKASSGQGTLKLSVDVRQKLTETFDEESAKVETILKEIRILYPSYNNELAEVYGDICFELPLSASNSVLLYYQSVICGGGTSDVNAKIAKCFERMVLNGTYPVQMKNTLRSQYLTPVGQDVVTEQDVKNWSVMASALRNGQSMSSLLSSPNPDIRKTIDSMYNNLISQTISGVGELRLIRLNKKPVETANKKATEVTIVLDFNFLKSLEEKTNPVDEIESVIFKLKQYRPLLLKSNEKIPNYQKISDVFPNSDEAEIINLYYRHRIFGDDERILSQIDQLKSRHDDMRVLFLRTIIALKLKRYDIVHESLNRILELDPKNYRARHMALSLEQIEDGLGQTPAIEASPQQGEPNVKNEILQQ